MEKRKRIQAVVVKQHHLEINRTIIAFTIDFPGNLKGGRFFF